MQHSQWIDCIVRIGHNYCAGAYDNGILIMKPRVVLYCPGGLYRSKLPRAIERVTTLSTEHMQPQVLM